MDAVRKQQPRTIRGIWECLNAPVYQAEDEGKNERINFESPLEAIRTYHLAYLKAHYRAASEKVIEMERFVSELAKAKSWLWEIDKA